MLICSRRIAKGEGVDPDSLKSAPFVCLNWDLRQKSRFDATDSLGRSLGVVLPRGTALRGGDVLVMEDSALVRVQAADQAVLCITSPESGNAAFALLRAAYHLGNRHVPVELHVDHLKIEPDQVLEDLLLAWGLRVHSMLAPFEPEGGAYADTALLGHNHAHGHGH